METSTQAAEHHPHVHDVAAADAHGEQAVEREVVYVYEAPVRMWHWINALAIVVLCVTGYLIGNPLWTTTGEASDNFLMGYIRFAHFTAAYVFAIGFLARVYWAIVGNYHARQIFYLPVWQKRWWSEIWYEIRWYSFAVKQPKKYIGHNPLAQIFMVLLSVTIVLMICSGFAMYAEGQGLDSWQMAVFGWVFDIFPNSQDVHSWHHLGMWGIICFVIVHIYAAVREDIMSRQSIISTMISGERMFKDEDND